MPDFPRSTIRWLVSFAFTVISVSAQFTVEGRSVQVHGFISQGFAYSDANNYLTMDTSKGSFAFTDAGINATSPITDKFTVGAQFYVRNVGQLGQGHVTLDWASGDYRAKDWFGIRAGKIKTVFGLYNDTQDAEFLHTWALLPQSNYPLDLRDSTIAHIGADIYGNLSLRKLGQINYTAYAGTVPFESAGGVTYALKAQDINPHLFSGSTKGGDLRWTPPISGLLLGYSLVSSPFGVCGISALTQTPFNLKVAKEVRSVIYAQYTRGNLRLEAEYYREIPKLELTETFGPYGPSHIQEALDRRSWYTAVAYRISKRLELGTYNSRFFPNADKKFNVFGIAQPAPTRHLFDQTVTARIDIGTHLDLKLEGHFIDGYGDLAAARGFYPQDNPGQLSPKTNLFITRLGFNF